MTAKVKMIEQLGRDEFHFVVYGDGMAMADVYVRVGWNMDFEFEADSKGIEATCIKEVRRYREVVEAVEALHSTVERNVKQAKLLAASNHGMYLADCDSVNQVMDWWHQGLSECGHDEDKCEQIVLDEVVGFLAQLIGKTELPKWWQDIDVHLGRMEG